MLFRPPTARMAALAFGGLSLAPKPVPKRAPKKSYTYVREEAIPKDLFCSICLSPLEDPRVHPACENMFCAHCVASLKDCPLCRRSFVGELPAAQRYVRQLLDNLEVLCPACSQVATRESLEKHLAGCPVPCSLGCGVKVAPKDATAHQEKDCAMTLVSCKAQDILCPWFGQRLLLPPHLQSCPFEPLRPVVAALMRENQKLSGEIKDLRDRLQKLEPRPVIAPAAPVPSLFGGTSTPAISFGAPPVAAGFVFGTAPAMSPANSASASSSFGFGPAPALGGLLGSASPAAPAAGTGLFGAASATSPAVGAAPASPASRTGLFGTTSAASAASPAFGAPPARTPTAPFSFGVSPNRAGSESEGNEEVDEEDDSGRNHAATQEKPWWALRVKDLKV